MQSKKIWAASNIVREGRAGSPNTLAKLQKSVRTNLETLILPTTVWRVVRKGLLIKNPTSAARSSHNDNQQAKAQTILVDVQEKREEEFCERLMFSHEATFHTNSKVNMHYACI